MAAGDLVFSHVARDGGALVCSPAVATRGAMCYYLARYYFRAQMYVHISWIDNETWSFPNSPWDTSIGAAWDNALGLTKGGGAPGVRYWGETYLWYYYGSQTSISFPDSTNGVVIFTSNSQWPYQGGRYWARAWLHSGTRYYVEFEPNGFSQFYKVYGTYNALNGRFDGTATVSARGANYPTGTEWDINLDIIIQFYRFQHNPACPH